MAEPAGSQALPVAQRVRVGGGHGSGEKAVFSVFVANFL